MVPYRAVHEGLDTADDRGVDAALSHRPVHRTKKVEQDVEPLELREAQHKAHRLCAQGSLEALHQFGASRDLLSCCAPSEHRLELGNGGEQRALQ